MAATNGAVKSTKSNRWMGRCLLREAREKALNTQKEKKHDKKDVSLKILLSIYSLQPICYFSGKLVFNYFVYLLNKDILEFEFVGLLN